MKVPPSHTGGGGKGEIRQRESIKKVLPLAAVWLLLQRLMKRRRRRRRGEKLKLIWSL